MGAKEVAPSVMIDEAIARREIATCFPFFGGSSAPTCGTTRISSKRAGRSLLYVFIELPMVGVAVTAHTGD